jgi:hypothetical protein
LPFLFSFCLVLPIFSPCPYFFFLIFLFSTFRFFPLPLFLLSFHALPSHAFMGDWNNSVVIRRWGCIGWWLKKFSCHPTYSHCWMVTKIL